MLLLDRVRSCSSGCNQVFLGDDIDDRVLSVQGDRGKSPVSSVCLHRTFSSTKSLKMEFIPESELLLKFEMIFIRDSIHQMTKRDTDQCCSEPYLAAVWKECTHSTLLIVHRDRRPVAV